MNLRLKLIQLRIAEEKAKAKAEAEAYYINLNDRLERERKYKKPGVYIPEVDDGRYTARIGGNSATNPCVEVTITPAMDCTLREYNDSDVQNTREIMRQWEIITRNEPFGGMTQQEFMKEMESFEEEVQREIERHDNDDHFTSDDWSTW